MPLRLGALNEAIGAQEANDVIIGRRANLVQTDYLTFLLRPADPIGLTSWVAALNTGATDQQVLAGIFGSPEGYVLWS